ncbi:ribokinase [Rhizobium sp. 16-449-1b]|uniref:ribokinase n=1 Tax=Rhizobium sp. 16-449-1b TaxID=2819989 RepID=UPI001ADA4EBF|nr:ribokinase [Rhizobium sp. 16-449-1b]MBO9196896.1 ribokinase [Rhizobium sp. 16-449-1b]
MIVVLGSINLDIRFEVESLPQAGETLHAHGRSHFGGGKGANQALAARRAGADAFLFGAVGDDQHAEIALQELVESGVSISDVAIVQEDTGSANIYVDWQGENCIVVAAGANGLVDIDMAATAVARAQKGLLVLQQEVPFDTNKAALELARLHDVRTVLNVSPFDATSAKLSRLADVVIANQHEWAKLSDGAEDPEAMRAWSRRNNQILVVTKGAAGVTVSAPEEYFEVAAPGIQPLDTVGAGDTFCGYFAAELDRGGSLREAAEIAVVAASMACLQAGAQPSIPRRPDVLRALAERQRS